jgi:hypothetical protein
LAFRSVEIPILACPDRKEQSKNSHKMENQIGCMVMASALTGSYFAAANLLLEKVAEAPAQAQQIFEGLQERIVTMNQGLS